jgi:tetratricopeptide (TPR) repeat protein
MTATLTISLIVRNEEQSLGRCLDSVQGLGDEIVVVDTGSTDGTREVAASRGARVFDFPWCDDFAAARNETLRHATGRWVLWLDADEYFDEGNRQKVRQLLVAVASGQWPVISGQSPVGSDGRPLATDHRPLATLGTDARPLATDHWPLNTAFVMVQRSHHAAGQTGSRVQQVRLFPRHPEVRWEYRVHEQLLPSLRRAGVGVRFTDIVIEHTGYVDPALRDRKMARNLRLLHLDQAERPDDPFTLFNLGVGYSQLGKLAEAIGLLRRSLERSRPGDSIVPKLYAALVRAHDRLGQAGEARAACRAGRVRCPEDAELLFLDGLLRKASGDGAGAEVCWRQLVNSGQWPVASGMPSVPSGECSAGNDNRALATDHWPLATPPGYFSDVDEGFLAGAREQLGVLCREQGRDQEAEEHWLAVVKDRGGTGESAESTGDSRPPLAMMGLAELYLAQKRYQELEQVAGRLNGIEGRVLLGRAHLARREFAEARRLLESAIAQAPQAMPARVFLTHVLLQEGRDLAAAEKALRELLLVDPGQSESWRNLAVLLRSQNRLGEALEACRSARAHGSSDPELALMYGMLLHEAGDLLNAETILLEVLERSDGQDCPSYSRKNTSVTARHNLALLYRRQGRTGEAESQWRAVLSQMPDPTAAWLGLGELFLDQGRIADVEAVLHRLESIGQREAASRLRAHLHRTPFARNSLQTGSQRN